MGSKYFKNFFKLFLNIFIYNYLIFFYNIHYLKHNNLKKKIPKPYNLILVLGI